MDKTIHYCWFGGNPLPDLAIKCIQSWKKYCPDYKIIEWNESNFDVNCCAYVKEAYQAKKWAFVSDYARFKILYEHGGIYFDTDVELIKPIDDIVEYGAFMGIESKKKISGQPEAWVNVAPGLGMAAEKGNLLYQEILDKYHKAHFLKEDNTFDYTNVVRRTTELLRKYGLKDVEGIQIIEGIHIYPQEYFCPLDYDTNELCIMDNTYSIHWYNASWFSEEMKKRRECCTKIRQKIKGEKSEKICACYMQISYILEKLRKEKLKIVVRKIFKK